MVTHEPYKIKSVRNINFYNLSQRKRFLRAVDFNVSLLPSSQISFDMVTQGASGMSQEQLSALFVGDEAYAGARNFYNLNRAVKDVFNIDHVCPIHNRFGGLKLLCSIYVSEDKTIGGNTSFPNRIVEYFGGGYHQFSDHKNDNVAATLDFQQIKNFLKGNNGSVPFFYIDLQGEGYQPFSLETITKLKSIIDPFDTKLVFDVSCISELAYYLIKHDESLSNKTVAEVIQEITGCCDTVLFDAGQDAMSNVGGFLATNDPVEHKKYMNEVVVFEGLHTYGGMAGRTMEVVAAGLNEMVDDHHNAWIANQVGLFADKLEKAKVPFTKGLNGIYLNPKEFLQISSDYDAAHTLAAALYLHAGIRAHLEGVYQKDALLPILIPRRALLNTQLEQIATAIIRLYRQKDNIQPLISVNKPEFNNEARFEWIVPDIEEYSFQCEPYTVHAIEYVGMKDIRERKKAMKDAGYNTFLLKSEDVTIDFLTDSGTSAMSVDQWNKYLQAKETPAVSDAYQDIVKTSQEIYGYKYVILTHQGRAAEHIMSQMFIKPGDYVPGNMYFTTTKLHQELAGGIFVDVIVNEAHQTTSEFPWKGNIDLNKLDALYEKASEEGKKIAYVSFEFNVNMAGGQPVSMDNIKQVYQFCQSHKIPVFFDATRCAENACFIQKRDQRYQNVSIADILLEMFSYGDGATISCKKDMLSNLSGSLLFRNNEEWYDQALRLLQIFEGPHCSGGTSAGDMAAHAQGLREMVNDAYINSRVDQTNYLGELLSKAGIPIVLPPGGHAIFLDAEAFLPHIDQDEYPAQMLAAQLFIETGVRAMERGNVSKGRNPETGKNYCPDLELVRLTIPRRVYTRDHLKAVADGIIRLYKKRDSIKGLRFTDEPEKLRFFQGRFEEIPD